MKKYDIKKFQISYHPDSATIRKLIELDKSVYNISDIGVYDKCMEWYCKNGDIYTVLSYQDKPIGYINFMPITDECYKQYRTGKMHDYEINKEDIVQFSSTCPNKCIFTSIVVDTKFQNTPATILLIQALIKKLTKMNAKISSVLADCVSEKGLKGFTKFFNAKYICDSLSGKIYEGTIHIK